MNKLELLKKIKDVKIDYISDAEEIYYKLYDLWMDYLCDTNDYEMEYIFNDICTYELAEDIAKNELETGGLIRLYYFLGNANLNNNLFKVNGYGNLEDLDKSDVEYIKRELIYNLEKDLKL